VRLLELVGEDTEPALVHPRLHGGSLRRREDGATPQDAPLSSQARVRPNVM
jgi:hypothetical protein